MPDATPEANPTSQTFSPSALRGKTAVVTGAARGIGRAAAIALAAAGANVAGIDLATTVDPRSGVTPSTPDELTQTGNLVQAKGVQWHQTILDQRDRSAVRRAASEIESAFGKVDILFANAGIQQFHPLLEMTDDDWDITIDTNLTGTANVLRAFAPGMVRHKSGRIIITTSTQGEHGTLNGSAYSSSKFALIGLMKSAALELGKHGITVNCLVPGLIDTPLTRHEERYAQALEKSGKTPTGNVEEDEKAAKEGLTKSSPLRVPWIDPDDIAPTVVFLASEAARMISGASFAVTAGDSANNLA
ncbi:SDR family NAD(P)-dependent oxidoreductase [Terriglobus aquaticus]|uniref:SDR family NAD(P)-dependent oxidoreductase n=1 Tax=Terriglobus aquaticus TaxID=940139 RepID=A0ABW9KMK4_9BACT|nr:SDR family NAD(P)-dependent oxidoreductase [Terriglobus aquaticus]